MSEDCIVLVAGDQEVGEAVQDLLPGLSGAGFQGARSSVPYFARPSSARAAMASAMRRGNISSASWVTGVPVVFEQGSVVAVAARRLGSQLMARPVA
jgi:hypothetical protein